MSRKPENVFIASIHRHLPVDLYSMKTHNPYISGPADVWYSGRKADLWVEYKFIVMPKHDGTVIDLTGGKSPAITDIQQDWLIARHNEGRSVGVIVGCKEGGVWFPGLTWQKPLSTSVFRSRLVTRPKLAEIICGFVYA